MVGVGQDLGGAGGRDAAGEPLQVQLRRPPTGHAVLKFDPRRGICGVTVLRQTSCRGDRDFEIARLLEIVIVGDEVGAFLRSCRPVARTTTFFIYDFTHEGAATASNEP